MAGTNQPQLANRVLGKLRTWIDKVQGGLRGVTARLQFWARAGVLLLVVAVVAVVVGPLGWLASTNAGPSIVRLEVAGSAEAFNELVARARDAGASLAVPLWWDFAFIAAYATALVLACLVFGPVGYRISALFGAAGRVAILTAAAAVLDVVENVLLLTQVSAGVGSDAVVGVAAACAWAKLALLAVVLLYVAGALAGFLVRPAWLVAPWEVGAPGSDGVPPSAEPKDSTGAAGSNARALAISGGGVRSASFALGALQRLDSPGSPFAWDALRRVTAISGGSYMAGAWLIARPPVGSPARDAANRAWQASGGTGEVPSDPRAWLRTQGNAPGPEERHLRANLGYLLEPAPSTKEQNRPAVSPATSEPSAPARGPVGAVGMLLAGLLCNLLALFVVLATLALPLGWLVGSDLVDPLIGTGQQLGPDGWDRLRAPVLVWALVTAGCFVVWIAGRRLLSARSSWVPLGRWAEEWAWVVTRAALVLTTVLGLVLLLIPWSLESIPALEGPGATARWVQAALAAGLLGTLAKLVNSAAKVGVVKQWVPRLGGLLLAAVAVLVGGWLAYGAAAGSIPPGPRVTICAAVGLLAYTVVNPEWWALAPFYRGRLRSAYALHRVRSDQGDANTAVARAYSGQNEPLLSDYATSASVGPDLTICTAANVSDKSEHTVYGIPAWSLTMSPRSVTLHRPLLGGPATPEDQAAYECSPRVIEQLWSKVDNPRYTVMAAVGMSGAAVSPGLGRFTKGSTNSLLALANVRLGVWMPNPKHASAFATVQRSDNGSGALQAAYPRVRIGYLLKELLGIFDPDDLYVYVTDGGHWDNSGVVEQVRDGAVSELVCLDGSGAAAGGMGTLSDAMTLAKEETGAEIRVDFRPLRLAEDKTTSQRAITLGTIDYRNTRDASQALGLLWYCRPAITTTMRPLIAAYREQHPRFPNDSTLNQFFSDLQFEAYRQLGQDTAADLLHAREHLAAAFANHTTITELKRHADTDPTCHWTVRAFIDALPDLTEPDLRARYEALRSALGTPPRREAVRGR